MIVLSVLSSHSRGMGHFFRTIRLAEIAKDQDRTILIIIKAIDKIFEVKAILISKYK